MTSPSNIFTEKEPHDALKAKHELKDELKVISYGNFNKYDMNFFVSNIRMHSVLGIVTKFDVISN